MKTIHLDMEEVDLKAVIDLARQEPVLLLTADGKEFLISEADGFSEEVEILSRSRAFQQFLHERSACSHKRISLMEIEAEIARELAAQDPTR